MVKVKICGLRTPETIQAAIDGGAHYIGFVLAENSVRHIAKPELVKLMKGMDFSRVQRVGVFVNPDLKLVRDCFAENLIDIAQLHGDETPEFSALFPKEKIWKRVRSREEAESFPVGAWLIDHSQPGSGQTGDWNLARELVKDYPEQKIFLAGGIDIHNAEEAIRKVAPYGLDLSSSVEETRGVKSTEKIKQFLQFLQRIPS